MKISSGKSETELTQNGFFEKFWWYFYFCLFQLFNFRKQAQAAKVEAEKEGIVVPVTLEDYCIKTRARPVEQPLDMTDFYDDEYELDDDDDEDEQLSASDYEDGDDSGNGESWSIT